MTSDLRGSGGSRYTEEPDAGTRNYIDDKLKETSQELRKDFIAIFGVFAAFLTFTVVQIGVLIQKTTMPLIMGAASFFLGSSLVFVLALQHLASPNKMSLHQLIRLIILSLVILCIFFFSFQCFWYSVHQDLWG